MKKTILIVGILLSFFQLKSQEEVKTLELNLGSDLVSRYVWRGSQFSNSPSVQPSLVLNYSGFEFGFWGSYSFDGLDASEVDLYASYTCPRELFTLTFTDYFFSNTQLDNGQYFNYKKNETGHIFEGSLAFNGTERFPLSVMIATNFYGDDSERINNDPASDDFNNSVGIQFSTYVELGYSFKIKDVSLDAFVGFTPNKPKISEEIQYNGNIYYYEGESGFYGREAGLVNIGVTGSYDLPISEKFTMPIFSSLIINPMSEKIFLVFGISI